MAIIKGAGTNFRGDRMLKNVKAILFDLDGTLVDSMWLWKAIDIDYLSKRGLDLPSNLQSEIEGMSFTETAVYFKNRFNLTDDVEAIKNEWNKMAGIYYAQKVPLKEQVEAFLIFLKRNNIKMGIGTSNSTELVQTIIKKYELEKYFDSVRTSCEVDRGKPYPDIYLKVAEDLGVHPDECLVFEDVPMGIKAGKSAGMKVCAVYDDFSKHVVEEIKSLADYYIESFKELLEMIEDENDETIFAD